MIFFANVGNISAICYLPFVTPRNYAKSHMIRRKSFTTTDCARFFYHGFKATIKSTTTFRDRGCNPTKPVSRLAFPVFVPGRDGRHYATGQLDTN